MHALCLVISPTHRCKVLDTLSIVDMLRIKLTSDSSQVVLVRGSALIVCLSHVCNSTGWDIIESKIIKSRAIW